MSSEYDHVSSSNQSGPNASRKKKQIAMIAGSAVVLVAMVAAVAVSVSRRNAGHDSSSGSLATTSKAVHAICQPTDYKEECESSLGAAAGNTTDPKELIVAAFDVATGRLVDALKNSSVIQAAATDPRTTKALEDCEELLNSAISDLKGSVSKFADFDMSNFGEVMDDLKVWLSAAITSQETCLDGFENTTGSAAEDMRKALNSSTALTSNALAIIDELSSVLGTLPNRKLLADKEFPPWVAKWRRRLLALSPQEMKPAVTVAQDGSGDVKTIGEALARVPPKGKATFVIYVKAGVYKETVHISRAQTNVMMVGDGPTKTVITGNANFVDGTPTFRTATVAVVGDGFIAKNLGFENTAGPEKHQAVALRVQSDKSIFYNCQMDGYQDTLYVHTKRQFYRECTISGTIDFVFGNSAVVFQNCLLLVRKPMPNQQNIITAQGRKDRHEPTAIIIQNCTIAADPAYYPVRATIPSFLGRPWKPYSRTIVMQSSIDDLISPKGWLPWAGDLGLNTLFYAEVDNRGAGAATTQRVNWKGIKKLSYDQLQRYTTERFIQGNSWVRASGVPYIPGLLPMSEPGRIH